jgi:hypothetical protein
MVELAVKADLEKVSSDPKFAHFKCSSKRAETIYGVFYLICINWLPDGIKTV